jgi:hypothetical protein
MKRTVVAAIMLICLHLVPNNTKAQPIPVEFMAGNRYASVNVVVIKNFSETSRFGFFHLNSLTMNYNDKTKDDLALQNLLFFEFMKNVRVTGGAFYASVPGFSPTAGMQYINAGKKWFILFAPRVNIENDPSFNVFSIIRFRTKITEHTRLYTSLQALNIFDVHGHIKSYQWFRAGVETQGFQFGLGANFDEFGAEPKLSTNFGVFIRKEIF